MTAAELFGRLSDQVVEAGRLAGRPYLIGITGPDASGKSVFAEGLQTQLLRRGARVQVVHVDDFHRPRGVRYAGDRPEHMKYLEQSFDLDVLVAEVLLPLREQGCLDRRMRHLDVATDEFTVERHYSVNRESIVVVEGVFLLAERIRGLLDKLIFLTVASEELVRRGVARDAQLLGPDAERRFREKYLPAQDRFFAQADPNQHADIMIDNGDWNAPRIVRWGT